MRKEVMEISVLTREPIAVENERAKAIMIPFTAAAKGECFSGKTVTDGFDTQRITSDGGFSLSARYIMEGVDMNGHKCRVFIENNGTSLDNCIPVIVTDSPALSFLMNSKLHSTVECVENGVIVRIFAEIPE